MTDTPPADPKKPLSPGEYIREELKARGWTQSDLARILGRPLPTVNRILQGTHAIMPEMAVALGEAFGTGPDVWMQREASYRLSLAKVDGAVVRKRARLYEAAPIKEIQGRGWISQTDDPDELERELLAFFETDSLDRELDVLAAFRKTCPDEPLTPAQKAWYFRARHLARALKVSPFLEGKLRECEKEMRRLAAFPKEARKVPTLLAAYGIRFVVVEPLAGSKIDGAAFWLGPNAPAIALSLRYDRVDAFWFNVGHEFSHIKHRDATSIDTDLVGQDQTPLVATSPVERRANLEAAAMLIPPDQLNSFILRVGPMYSKERIIQFANRIKIHPGIIVGQLQHRGEIGFHANRDMLVKIRETVATESVTDGWGRTIDGRTTR